MKTKAKFKKVDVTEFLLHSNWIERERSTEALEDAEKAWKYIAGKKKITVNDVLEIHRLLTNRINPRIAGKIRDCDVWIGGEHKKFIGREILISQLEQVLPLEASFDCTDDPEQATKDCHVLFEHVHPFEDGNGRVGRIIYNWHRMQLGLPIHIITIGTEQHYYYEWFRKKVT